MPARWAASTAWASDSTMAAARSAGIGTPANFSPSVPPSTNSIVK